MGERVCALLPGGGYAESAKAPGARCLPIPDGLSLREAACLPETLFTVWSNVFSRGGFRAGERVPRPWRLIGDRHGGDPACAAFRRPVFATAGSEAKCQTCIPLGAEWAISYSTEDFGEVLRDEGGADLILDMVRGGYIARNVRALANDGWLVMIPFLGGAEARLTFSEIMVRRLTVTGSTLRPRWVRAKAAIAEELRFEVWPLLEAGRVWPVMDRSFPLAQARDAHARMEASEHIGKMVLEVVGG